MTTVWQQALDFEDIVYEKCDGIAKISINRPQVHNAFRPETVKEIQVAFNDARDDAQTGMVILTGTGGRANPGQRRKMT